MKTIEDHLKRAIAEAVEPLGVSAAERQPLELYLDNQWDEAGFLSSLQKTDLDTLPQAAKSKLRTSYESLKKHKVGDYLNKFIKILIAADEKNVVKLLSSWEYRFSDELYNTLLSCGINPAALISYCAEDIVRGEYTVSMTNINKLDKYYADYEASFPQAMEMCSINAKLCLTAYLAMKNPYKYSGLQKYTENSIKNSFKALFLNGTVSEDWVKDAVKYVDGGLLVTDRIVYQLKAYVRPDDINKYSLKLLLGLAYMIQENSGIGRRFIKFAVLLCFNEALERLHGFIMRGYNDERRALSEVEAIASKNNIPQEYIIAWMGSSNQHRHRFEKELVRKSLEKRKEFESAIKLLGNDDATYLASLLWSAGAGSEFLQQAEEKFLDEFTKYLQSLNIPSAVCSDIIAYVKGEKELDTVREIARNAVKAMTGYHYYNTSHLEILFRLGEKSEIFDRVIRLHPVFYNYNIMNTFINRLQNANYCKGVKNTVTFLEKKGAGEKELLYYTVECAINSYNKSDIREAEHLVDEFIAKGRNLAEEIIGDCSAQGRALLLEALYNNDRNSSIPLIVKYMEDSSKAVKDKIEILLSDNAANIQAVAPSLLAKKQSIREMAVRILSCFKDTEAVYLLQKAYEVEKSEKVKALISKALDMEDSAAAATEDADLEEYCKSIIKRSSKTVLKWMDFDTLPKVKLKGKDTSASDEISAALLIAYSSNGTIAVSTEAKKICEALDEGSVNELALQALSRWLESGAEAKKKWVMAFSAVHGDYRVVEILKKNIEEWPLKARGAIACEAVRALALNGSNAALMIVDGISRKFKFKQVKEAAAAALTYAAEQLGMDKEELSDKIVPNLGFDSRGEHIFDYGSRKFTVRLTLDLSMEILDENEKIIKKLPETGKKDDSEKAAAAQNEFKVLKKQLKNTVSIQAMRLELALSSNRLWTKEAWTSLFVDNPIMHQFAMGLIWGVYENYKLKDTFRYMEDGTFNTKDEDEYELTEGSLVGLVHPVELTEEDRQLWKEQLENYEIKQPFLQIARPIYVVTGEEKDAKSIERFGGIIINSLSLLGKITTSGWYKGSVLDGGGYYNFYKEDRNHGIGASLEFSGTFVGAEGEGEEVTIYDITFYKSGTVERGSYIYDTVKEQNLIRPGQVPARLFSEILYNVDRALTAQIGVDENWKLKK